MTYRINESIWNTQAWNGLAFIESVSDEAKILYNQTTIVLDWAGFEDAVYYQVQVSLFPDFRSLFVNQSVIDDDYTFTDSQTNNVKRYWRWRPSTSVGADFLAPWSEVGSYWLDTGADAEVTVSKDRWAIFDPDDTNDISWLDLAPVYSIVPENSMNYQIRNRLGEMLSEFLTVKSKIKLNFTGAQYVAYQQLNEFKRFSSTLPIFFLATYKIGERGNPMPHIWKVKFSQSPSFTMIAAGRHDLVAGTAVMEEA